MNDKIIAIDVGHARGTGARGNGLKEHEVCAEIAEYLSMEIQAKGLQALVVDYPGKTNAGDLAETVRAVNASGAVLCVSLHCDASDNALAKGAHVIYTSEAGGRCAGYIAKHLCSFFPGRANKTVKRGNLYVLNNTRCVAVLCECGFLTNPDDASRLATAEGKRSVARRIAVGITEYLQTV